MRTFTVINQASDALVSILKRIDSANDFGNWLTSPQTIRRGIPSNPLAVPRPALLVSAGEGEWEDATDVGGWSIHRTRITFIIYCISEAAPSSGPEDQEAETALCNLVSDVVKAVTDDETLKGFSKIELPRFRYRGDVEASRRFGLSIGRLEYTAVVEWRHGTP